MTPICVSTMIGSTPSTAKTAASTMPALVMTPPVAASARTTASRVGWPSSDVLAGAGDEEDAVVDAERHEEQEAQQRHALVQRREAEAEVEDQPGGAEGGEVRHDGAQHEQQRREQRPQQHREHEEDQHEHQRDDDARVAGGRLRDVVRLRRLAADRRVGAGTSARRSRRATQRRVGAVGAGGAVEDAPR